MDTSSSSRRMAYAKNNPFLSYDLLVGVRALSRTGKNTKYCVSNGCTTIPECTDWFLESSVRLPWPHG